MKKNLKIVFFALSFFAFSQAFAKNIYCPQTVTCLKGHCNFPSDFYLSNYTKKPIEDKTYHFQSASFPTTLLSTYIHTCVYQGNGIGLENVKLKANLHDPDGHWQAIGSNKYACIGYDASKCPFIY
ncbi:MAG TPA: hypothetical protein VHM20_00470 [Gammaproteobacteria bacterium]|jgi:hypothetical protein|nr:hypothetical protein [Gammaproteobacteria bacterium]